MKKGLSFILLAFCLANIIVAQDDERPGWLDNKPKAGNSTYVYVVERASGTSVNEAVNNAIIKVMRNAMMRIGGSGYDEVAKLMQEGADWDVVAMKYDIPINKVCEYIERKTERGFLVAVLCQVAKSGDTYPVFDDFNACRDTKSFSNGGAVLRSAFIPGWGQMYKRHVGSGVFTLLGEVALVGGAVGTYYMAQQKLDIMRDHEVTITRFENAKWNYEAYRYAHIACISAAGALYIFNLVRAGTMTPKYKKRSLTFAPSMMPTDDGLTPTLNLTLKF